MLSCIIITCMCSQHSSIPIFPHSPTLSHTHTDSRIHSPNFHLPTHPLSKLSHTDKSLPTFHLYTTTPAHVLSSSTITNSSLLCTHFLFPHPPLLPNPFLSHPPYILLSDHLLSLHQTLPSTCTCRLIFLIHTNISSAHNSPPGSLLVISTDLPSPYFSFAPHYLPSRTLPPHLHLPSLSSLLTPLLVQMP